MAEPLIVSDPIQTNMIDPVRAGNAIQNSITNARTAALGAQVSPKTAQLVSQLARTPDPITPPVAPGLGMGMLRVAGKVLPVYGAADLTTRVGGMIGNGLGAVTMGDDANAAMRKGFADNGLASYLSNLSKK
jgi:hypothetical protein